MEITVYEIVQSIKMSMDPILQIKLLVAATNKTVIDVLDVLVSAGTIGSTVYRATLEKIRVRYPELFDKAMEKICPPNDHRSGFAPVADPKKTVRYIDKDAILTIVRNLDDQESRLNDIAIERQNSRDRKTRKKARDDYMISRARESAILEVRRAIRSLPEVLLDMDSSGKVFKCPHCGAKIDEEAIRRVL